MPEYEDKFHTIFGCLLLRHADGNRQAKTDKKVTHGKAWTQCQIRGYRSGAVEEPSSATLPKTLLEVHSCNF